MTLELDFAVASRGVEVDLSVPDGEVVALVGPNGAGKSTVLAAIAGLVHPTSGSIRMAGQTLADARTRVPTHRRGVGMLTQDPALFPHLTALRNVAFAPRCAGLRRRAAHAQAMTWLDRVGAAELADRRPGEVSGGQAQRIALARALAGEPQVLLLDEPLAALDVTVAGEVRHLLRTAVRGRTCLLVTHDVLDALLIADRVVVLEGGRVTEDGPAGVVLTRPRSEFAATLAGLNLVRGRYDGGRVCAPDGASIAGLPAETVAPDAPALAVFRPAAVSVFDAPPGGSPRNAIPVVVTAVEPHGDLVRVRAGGLAADVTPPVIAELALGPGREAVFVVKASEVSVYAA